MNQDRDSLLGSSSPVIRNLQNNDVIDTHIVEQPDTSINNYEDKPRKFRQIIAGLTATISALSAGVVMGWTSPILDDQNHQNYNNITIDNNQKGWIGSFVTLGAMAMCIPTGFVCDLIGRKKTLLLLTIPFTIGWILILLATNVVMLYFGRLATGTAVGACCIAAPLYTGEIAHKSLRGALGSLFQLMVTIGVFLAYLVGKYASAYNFTIFCAVLPLIFLVTFIFQPETPVYLLKTGKFEEAKSVLIKLRGDIYNIDSELLELESSLKESSRTAASLRSTFCQKSVKMATLIAFSLMFFQQLCGVNAVIMYTNIIFNIPGSKIDPKTETIFIGLFQALATLVASLVIDRLGRKFLLFISLSVVTISMLVLALFFSLELRSQVDSSMFSFVPVGALCCFIVAFSLGIGPIPWMISSEIFPTEVKSIIGSAAGTFNWFLAFLVTKFYLQVSDIVKQDSLFYFFTVISLAGTFFVIFVVPETKGKSLAEVQYELEQ